MDSEFNQLAVFISDFWSYNINKITKEKSLDNLGMYADDKKEFLMRFFKKFNIQHDNINFEKFCEPEIFNPFFFLGNKEKNKERKMITVNHLFAVMRKKEWFDPSSPHCP